MLVSYDFRSTYLTSISILMLFLGIISVLPNLQANKISKLQVEISPQTNDGLFCIGPGHK